MFHLNSDDPRPANLLAAAGEAVKTMFAAHMRADVDATNPLGLPTLRSK